MPATVPSLWFVAHQPQPCLMHERRGLESMPRDFVRHLLRGETAQFLIHQWKQFLGGLRVALLNAVKDVSDFAHVKKNQRPDIGLRSRGILRLRLKHARRHLARTPFKTRLQDKPPAALRFSACFQPNVGSL